MRGRQKSVSITHHLTLTQPHTGSPSPLLLTAKPPATLLSQLLPARNQKQLGALEWGVLPCPSHLLIPQHRLLKVKAAGARGRGERWGSSPGPFVRRGGHLPLVSSLKPGRRGKGVRARQRGRGEGGRERPRACHSEHAVTARGRGWGALGPGCTGSRQGRKK